MSLKEAQHAEPLMGHRGAREHLEFVHAVRRRDVETAEGIMRTHVERTAGRVKQ
jgi:GntR family transcriptional regulator, transcriptional repressor for pyruvate dehydrogenase complex